MDELLDGLTGGDRRALSRAITLIESTRADHRAQATDLIARLPERTALRIGLSGTPGVGKSTFIEAFGHHVIEAGHRAAVLAVDPSSKRGGGALLGDKTRMSELARNPRAFIRPSPAGATLGGVFAFTLDGYLGFAENGELTFGIRLLVHLPHLRRWSDRIKNASIGDARFGVIGNQLVTIGGNSLARVRRPAGLG